MLTQALVHYAWVATYTGDWQAAVEAGREASALAQETRQPQYGLTAMMVARDEAGYGKVDPLMAVFNAAHLMSLNPAVKEAPAFQMFVLA